MSWSRSVARGRRRALRCLPAAREGEDESQAIKTSGGLVKVIIKLMLSHLNVREWTALNHVTSCQGPVTLGLAVAPPLPVSRNPTTPND